MNIDECLAALAEYDKQTRAEFEPDMALPKRDFYTQVASHWFHVIAPDKTREYGTECWERLGPQGFVVNMSAMRYRWAQMVKYRRELTHPAMFNCVVDAFGFAMLFNLCLGIEKLEFNREPVLVRLDDEWIIDNLWTPQYNDKLWVSDSFWSRQVGMRAIRMAYNMWCAT